MIPIACSCGKKLQARDESAGKKVKCPACGNLIPVVDPFAPQDISVAPQSAVTMDWSPGTSGRASSGCLSWIFTLFFLLIVFAIGGVGGWFGLHYFGPRLGLTGGTKTVLDLVPADAAGFVAVRVADGWNAKIGEPIRLQAKNDKLYKLMKEKFGLTPEDIEWVVVVQLKAPNVNRAMKEKDYIDKQAGDWLLVQTKKPYDKDKIIEAAKTEIKAKEKTHDDKTYYAFNDKSMPKSGGFYFIDATKILLARENDLQDFLDRKSKTQTEGPLKDALALARSKMVTAAFQLDSKLRKDLSMFTTMADVVVPGTSHFAQVKTGYLTVDEKSTKLNFKLGLMFPDDAKASQATKTAKDLVQLGKAWIAKFEQVPPDQMQIPQDLLKTGKTVLAATTIQQQGSTLEISMAVEVQPLVDAWKKSLAAGAPEPPGK